MGRFKRLRRTVRYPLIRAALWPLEVLPRPAALQVGRLLGEIVWRCNPRLRERVRANLQRVTGSVSEDSREFGRLCLRTMGSNAVDFLRLPRLDRTALERMVRVEGEEHLVRALARGRGVVVATGHVGNWELLAAYYARRGFPVHVLARSIRDARFDRFVDARRRACGILPICRQNGLFGAAMALRRGAIVGILFDQDTRAEGLMLPFLGLPAFTPVGPAALSRATGAALIPMAIHGEEGERYRITVLPEVPVSRTRDRESDLRDAMTMLNAALEDLILRRPEEWVWFHDRWRAARVVV
jgi:Kdo2-lipid IVA lauroyltransferase/acyltransferase